MKLQTVIVFLMPDKSLAWCREEDMAVPLTFNRADLLDIPEDGCYRLVERHQIFNRKRSGKKMGVTELIMQCLSSALPTQEAVAKVMLTPPRDLTHLIGEDADKSSSENSSGIIAVKGLGSLLPTDADRVVLLKLQMVKKFGVFSD